MIKIIEIKCDFKCFYYFLLKEKFLTLHSKINIKNEDRF